MSKRGKDSRGWIGEKWFESSDEEVVERRRVASC